MWPQNIKAVLFDMDGTLVDSENLHYQNTVQLCEIYGGYFSHDDDDAFMGRTMSYIFNAIKERFADSSVTFADFQKANEALFAEGITKEHLFKGVREALDYLQQKNIPLCLVTNSEKNNAEVALKKTEIWDYFDKIITSHDVANGKPHPEPYAKAADFINIAIENCMVVEDSEAGIESGLKAGAYVVAIKGSLPEDKLKKAHKIVENFAEIPFQKIF